jgi:CubicO group peptidase (beta-lactamase class C family)
LAGSVQKTNARITKALERAVELGEVGVQVAAYLGERLIVDAWIGAADPTRGKAVDGDTLFQCFSMIKTVTFTALHIQVERGLVEYDAPVARYWPEFGSRGKDRILVRHVLEHRSGVPHLPAGAHPIDPGYGDWDAMVKGIADLEPLSPPGTESMYQAHSMGWILGTVIERTDPKRRGIKQFIEEEILGPLEIEDIFMGLPAEEDRRYATLVGGPLVLPPGAPPRIFPQPDEFNRPSYRRALNVAGSGIMNARAQARLWALLANRGELGGVRLLREGRVWSFTQPRPNPLELDAILGYTPYMGVGGYWLGGHYPPAEPGVGEGCYILCQTGGGGSIGWADLESRLAVAICHNRLFLNQPPVAAEEHPHTAIGNAVRDLAAEFTSSR